MSLADSLEKLQSFDVNDIDFENIGSWPMAAKILVWILVFVGVLAAGYWFDIKEMQGKLAKIEKKEVTLRKDFERKAHEAANLKAYKLQMDEMERSFGALLAQLPTDTEVPGLLEDITNKGLESGLVFRTIKLQTEKNAEFYTELPIEVVVEGTYHELGSFVSGVAGMPRIVTLHDFDIRPVGNSTSHLQMTITAKTYRYKNKG